jgi:hypothetical protein
MHCAAQFGQLDLMTNFLSRGRCQGTVMVNELTETPLHLAAGVYTRCKSRLKQYFSHSVYLLLTRV